MKTISAEQTRTLSTKLKPRLKPKDVRNGNEQSNNNTGTLAPYKRGINSDAVKITQGTLRHEIETGQQGHLAAPSMQAPAKV